MIHMTDFYKIGHYKQYPDNTEFIYSNFTCRSDKHALTLPDFDHKVVWFGLQGICQWLLIDAWNANFFHLPKEQVVAQYRKRMIGSLGPEAGDTRHIEALHDLGYLPIRIKALPEGSRVNIRVPLFTIVNTDKRFYWLTNYLETQLSAEVHKAVTVATIAHEYKRLLVRYAESTGGSLDFVPYQGHDFSMRGMSGIHDAMHCGAAHLLSFNGTDTIPAIDYVEQQYAAEGIPFGSVPATEHSVMCAGGEESELETYRRLITKIYPSGIVSIVSDTWDFWRVLTEHTVALYDEIVARDGKVVFRPDSGDPVKIICGDPYAAWGTPQHKGAVVLLDEIFGHTVTHKGYKTLCRKVGLIYGDSITLDVAQRILSGLEQQGYSSENIVFGIGSYTYNYVTRDTFGAAIKATYCVIDGKKTEMFKKPKTDDGVKNSAKGLIVVVREGKDYVMRDQQQTDEGGLLETKFLDGKIVNFETFSQIRNRLERE